MRQGRRRETAAKGSLGRIRGIALEPTYFNLQGEPVDAARIVSEAVAAGANAIRLGALSHDGCAYYPSEVLPEAPGLDGRDVVGDFKTACAGAGIELVIYSNSKFVIEGAFADHPDWAEIVDGKPGTWQGPRPLTPLCHESPYFDVYLSAVREIMARYAPAVMYVDCFGVRWDCRCRWCGERFREAHGFDPPDSVNWGDAAWRAAFDWNIRRNRERALDIVAAVREGHPETQVVFNRGGYWGAGVGSPEGLAAFAHEIADNIHIESAVRFYGEPFEHIDEQCMIADAIESPAWVWVEYSVFPWSHLPCPASELRIKASRVLAHGARPMLWCLPSAPDADRSGLEGVGDIYRLARDHAPHFDETEPVAPVAILVSGRTMQEYGRDRAPNDLGADPRHVEEIKGFVAGLRRSHVPARFILDSAVERGDFGEAVLLVLANAACLSEPQCREVTAFAERGGVVLATHETSLYDERGSRRSDFGLSHLFGARWLGPGPHLSEREGWAAKMIASYVEVGAENEFPGDWPPGFRFPAGGESVAAEAVAAHVAGWLLAPTRYYCDFPGQRSGLPGLLLNQFGRGRCVYAPWQLGALYRERGFAELRRFMEAVARDASGGMLDVECDLPATVTVTARRTRTGQLVLHVLNLSTDPRAGVEGVVPVRGGEVSVRDSWLRGANRARALVAGVELEVHMSGGRASIALPDVQEYEVLVLGE